MEDKRAICNTLLVTLWSTREFEDLADLEYHKDGSADDAYVEAVFTDGRRTRIDVTSDSGIALIKDVINKL